MLRRDRLKELRQGYQLCRRRLRRDSYGELEAVFDLEHPDVVVRPEDPHAVAWHPVGRSHREGRLRSGAVQGEQGERSQEILQGALFSDLSLELWDRLVIGGKVYELRALEQWPGYRLLSVQRV